MDGRINDKIEEGKIVMRFLNSVEQALKESNLAKPYFRKGHRKRMRLQSYINLLKKTAKGIYHLD